MEPEPEQITPTGMPGMASGGSSEATPVRVFKSTPEQRAKWAEQKRIQKARQRGGPIPLAQISTAPRPVNPGAPVAAPVGVVPWNSAPLQPVCKAVISALEKVNVSELVEKAEKISPELRAMVERDAPWNPESKAALEAASPEAVAKVLNRFGISAEHGPEAICVGALISIVMGQWILSSKIDKALAAQADGAKKEKKA